MMLAYYFPPRGGSGVQRSLKFARYLPEHGASPVVISASEDEIAKTSDRSLLREIEGVPVYRAPSGERWIRRLSRWRLGPLVSLFLRPDAHVLWRKGVLRRAEQIVDKHGCSAIYVSVQPWSAALIGLELKKRHGLPLIVDFRDPWSFSTSLHWPSKWHHRRDCRLEERVFREADAIITVTPGLVSRYREIYPFAKNKIHLIYNGFDPDDFAEVPKQGRRAENKKLRLGFAGRLYSIHRSRKKSGITGVLEGFRFRNCAIDFSTHSLLHVVEALGKVFEREPGLRESFEFNLVGDVPGDNMRLVEEKGLSDCIRYHGLVPHRDAVSLMAESDVLFLPMMTEDSGRRSFNASGKVFEYLYNRKPILAAVPDGDAADLVNNARAGWVVNPSNVAELAEVFERLIRERQEGSPEVGDNAEYLRAFERRKQAGELAELLKSHVRSSGAGKQEGP